MSARGLLGPVVRLLGEVGAQRSLFWRSTAAMTGFQAATAAAAGLSTAVASLVTSGSTSMVALLLTALAAAVVAVAVLTWVESWLSHVLAYRVIDGLRVRVYDAVEQIVPARSGRRRAGEVAGTAMNDVEVLEWFYAHTLGAGLNALLSPTLVSIALVAMVGPRALIVPAGVALLLAIPWLLAGLQQRQGIAIRSELGRLQALSFEGAQARRELAALDLTGHHRAQVLRGTDAVQRARRRFALRAAGESALADLVVAATSLLFLVSLVQAAVAGSLDPVLIPPAMVLVAAAIAPAAGAFAMVQRLGEMSAAARRVLELIDEGERVRTSAPAASTATAAPARSSTAGPRGHVRLEAVRFAYGEGPPVLDGLDLDLPPGGTLALVGASGAGKSTLARLLTRLWDPQQGTITLDGVRIDALEPDELRRRVALVAQHPFVFRGTVRSNLLLAAPEATEEDLWAALTTAGLAETVTAWPGGLDTGVGDRGTTMSGGQRQRLSIAQAMLRDPCVLVLDEASAHLDAVGEQDLADAVAQLGLTTLVIAHRISTIRRADRVALLAGGRIAAAGSHRGLLQTCPEYRRLLAQAGAPEPEPAGPAGSSRETARR
ncbi:ABC transporter ATP-binding protein/permease [Ruania suaedae]|uniref:ABC transporter ATP-binding protein n=1 Tax=Ruania suaedae TaxID=2897774 RepID=UPI001E5D3DFD|nr:ABC transporter ATP-binding protein [Ruania suaedae]UFU01922.1 ABC transporter ATP-binding protein/permease [Ruania suaedae]